MVKLRFRPLLAKVSPYVSVAGAGLAWLLVHPSSDANPSANLLGHAASEFESGGALAYLARHNTHATDARHLALLDGAVLEAHTWIEDSLSMPEVYTR